MANLGTIYLVCASVLWGVLHSALASHSFKREVRNLAGGPAFDRMYRFSYNTFSVSSLYPIAMIFFTAADRPLYTIPAPWSYGTVIIQIIAVFVLISAVMQTGISEFIGWEQLSQIDESPSPTLMTDGLYAHVRHPLYAGILVFGWLMPVVTVNMLALLIVFTLYIFIGAWFEERKLLKDFGPAYAEYKARVPMLFPKLIHRKSKIVNQK